MDRRIELLVTQLDAVFDGYSFDGPPLMKTVESLDFHQLNRTDTFEGFSVWGVLLHVLYWKYEVSKMLGVVSPDYEFPYQVDNWPALPETPDKAAWGKLIADTREMHGILRGGILNMDADKLDNEIPEWKVPLSRGLLWAVTHDGYHTAQIRSMGIEGTKGES